MIRSWQPENIGSGSSWTPCWSRTSISNISRGEPPRLPLKAPPRNHLPLPALKIQFENQPGCSPLLSYPSGNSSRRCESLTFFLVKENWNPVPGNTSSSWRDAVGMETNDDAASPIPVLPSYWRDGVQLRKQCLCSFWDPWPRWVLGGICKPYFLFLVLKRRTAFHGQKITFDQGYFFIEIFCFPKEECTYSIWLGSWVPQITFWVEECFLQSARSSTDVASWNPNPLPLVQNAGAFPTCWEMLRSKWCMGTLKKETCSVFHSFKGQLHIFTLCLGWGRGPDSCVLSTEQLKTTLSSHSDTSIPT